MTTGFVAPLGEANQPAGDRFSASCRAKPGVLGDHEIVNCPRPAGTILKVGADCVCTGTGKAKKPPLSEYGPLVIGAPASGWPMLPVTENGPPVLVPPPESMADQFRAYWAWALGS